jgi:hypothetical protein
MHQAVGMQFIGGERCDIKLQLDIALKGESARGRILKKLVA